jgi:hypothetical protein
MIVGETSASSATSTRNFDWDGPLAFVQKSAGLSDRVLSVSKTRK